MSNISQAAAVSPALQSAQAMAASRMVTGAEGSFPKLLAAQLGANLMKSTLRALDEDTSGVDLFGDLLTTAALVQASGVARQEASQPEVEPIEAAEEEATLARWPDEEQIEDVPGAYGLQVVSASPIGGLQVTGAGPASPPSSVDRNLATDRALSRLGDPYSQSMRGSGAYVDCSYLVQWAYEGAGLSLPGTAAEQARYCVENGWTISRNELQRGDLVFWERGNCNCGRYREIHHVGIYLGDGRIVEASSSSGKVIQGDMWDNTGSWKIILCARPS